MPANLENSAVATGLEKAVSMINDLQPDLIVFTGDLVNNHAAELDNFIPVFSKLRLLPLVY